MTDKERNWVECEAQTLATICSQAVQVLKTEVKAVSEGGGVAGQDLEHRQLVLLRLSEYLARTTHGFTLLQSERARMVAEKHRVASTQQHLPVTVDLYGEEDVELEAALTTDDKLVLEQENKRHVIRRVGDGFPV